MKIIVFISFFLSNITIYGQSNSNEIDKLETRIKELKEELRIAELKLKTLRTKDQTGYTSSSINYSNEYIENIIEYLGPLEIKKENNKWIIYTIDAYDDLLLKIPIEDVYGLETFNEFWDVKKNKNYVTTIKPYLSDIICDPDDKVGFDNLDLETSYSSSGYVSSYFYNCSDKSINTYYIELKIYKFGGEFLEKKVVNILEGNSVKPGECKKVIVPVKFTSTSLFFLQYDYKIIGEKNIN